MFRNCSSLISLDLSNFNISKIIDINGMFDNLNKNCNIITEDKKILEIIKNK
jgi:surface protein